MRKEEIVSVTNEPDSPPIEIALLQELRILIEETRKGVSIAVNASLTLLYWRVGRHINEEVFTGERARYGEQIVSTLSRQLEISYLREFIIFKEPLQCNSSIGNCRLDGLNVSALWTKVACMLHKSTIPLEKSEDNKSVNFIVYNYFFKERTNVL
ncbi:hypothetical protein J2T58_001857 [Methanocalculus alkaliphilus]|uniref:DUF1016 N-terminal domain-containing protein n=1 Tax=Methanocalculus alkaliphilus TaxID=768730 RepID=UPI0020A1020D|nr:DUF1016 N-terminal domain-containing protein [Methanocalculus alkaliphilus]MCP1715983.1 hypothetical protein [Methanocalculus alkaliphilus]